ncbi:hypothetical protein [Georgenia wangjunii]|uniref:hypothetical protein n=1 Tax=Georgenia wangjunii TaxID=3117730 RepID=UPI002F265302
MALLAVEDGGDEGVDAALSVADPVGVGLGVDQGLTVGGGGEVVRASAVGGQGLDAGPARGAGCSVVISCSFVG